MTINDMKYFIEVKKCGNFSVAAKNLFITHPTLGRQMTKLEEELNMQLFFRTNKGVKMTPAGRMLSDVFEQVLRDLDAGISRSRVVSEGYNGQLKIGVLSGLEVGEFLQKFLHYMEQKYPNIHLELEQLSHGGIMDKLSHEEIDLAVSLDITFMTMQHLQIYPIKSYQAQFIIPASHPLAKKDEITFADLQDEEIVIVREGDCPAGEELITEKCIKYGGYRPHFYYAETMENEILWVESGLKCAILNDAMKMCTSDAVKAYPLQGAETEKREVQLTYKRGNANKVLSAVDEFFKKSK